MNRIVLFILCVLSAHALGADRTPAPLPPDKAVKAMVLPEGFVATLVASEPDVVQPISFCFDDRGRIFVAEAFNYGAWQATGKDRIIILEDTDGDGRFEKRTLFYEGLNYVTGIEVGFGGVWVMSPPNLLFIPDKNGDDKPDGEPQILFDGFGHKESRHNLANGFTWGPDGWLYAGHGRTSPSEVGRPGTPADKRIHCDGGVYRIHPTKLVFENFADGTTNPWGVSFDDFGQCFVSNCVNPHLFHMIQGGHYEPWRNRPSSLYAYDRLPTIADHLHYPSGKANAMRGETEEVLAMGGGHAHCGTLVYLGDNLPAKYRNSVFMCNIHGRRINNDILKRKGSGYTASHGADFMLSGDPWFMGVTLRTGPNGSIFVSDWSDTGECHTYKPDRSSGRIYQISFGPPRDGRVDLAKKSNEELAKMQLEANDWFVEHARRLLQERADGKAEDVHPYLRRMLAEHSATDRRLRALWTLHVIGGVGETRLLELLSDDSAHVRGWAIQLLCEDRKPSAKALEKFADLAKNDPSQVVRLYLASALQRLTSDQCWKIVEGLLSHPEDRVDANLPLMIWYGFEPLVPADPKRAILLAVASKIPLIREYAARRFVEQALPKGEQADLGPLANALTGSGDRDLLKGSLEALRGRKNLKMPSEWPAAFAVLAKSADAEVRDQARVLGVIFGDPQALASLRVTALSKTAPAAERRAALEALIDKRVAELVPTLHDLLTDKAVRQIALRGLAAIPHTQSPERILAVYADLTADEKQDAVSTLASRKEFALELLRAVDEKRIPRTDVSAYVARQLASLEDPKVTERLKQVWGEVRPTAPQKKEQLLKYKALLTPAFLKKADLTSGRQLFAKSCQACHKMFGEGGAIGPDLTGSNRGDLEYLLSNLIDPSAEVGRDFRMSAVTTLSGRKLTGILVERLPTRLTLQTATEKIVLAPDDVEDIQDSALSIMPENQLDALTKDQVRDLVGYLGTKVQVPLPADAEKK